MSLLLSAATDLTAERAGQIAGGWMALLALAAGAAKCAAIARRPTTSAPCAYGLMLVLLGWLAFGLTAALTPLGWASPLLTGLLALTGIVLFGVGLVLGLVGLIDYGRHPEYTQGRKQAGWAVGIVGGLLTIAAVGAFVAEIRRAPTSQSVSAPTGLTETADGVIVFDELNLRYRMPGRPYVRWDARKLNPAVTFGLLRTHPGVYMMVIAERTGDENALNTSGLAEIAKANLQSGSDGHVSDEVPHTVRDMQGIRFFADVTRGSNRLTYVFWVFAREGFCYQLIVWGTQDDRPRVREEAEALFGRFEQVEPDRQARDVSREPFGEYRSDDFAFSLDLTGKPWRKWPNATESNPAAEMGGLSGESSGFLVTPFVFQGPTPQPDALAQALLKEWGIEFPSQSVSALARVSQNGLEGSALSVRRTVDRTSYDYRMRILTGKGRGVFVAVWQPEGVPGLEERAREVMGGLRVPIAPAVSAVDRLPDRLRKAHARLYNRIGLFHFNAKDYGGSRRWFEAAALSDASDRVYLLNALRSYGELKQAKEGLAFLRALDHPARRDDEVLSWEAWFCKLDGQSDAALKLYREIFSRSFREDEDFKAFAGLLADAGQWAELQRSFDRYLASQPSLALRLEEARLLGDGGRHREAVELLEREQRGLPFSVDLTWALLRQHAALGQQRQRIALCELLIKNGLPSADAFYEKGDAEARLKWYQRAKASFEAALKIQPDDAETRDYLQHVSALLGEGNNSDVKEAITPVPLPATLRERLARLPSKDVPGYGARYVYWIQGLAFEKGRRAVETTRQRVSVADKSGVERFSTLAIDYDPLAERVYVNELLVRESSGAVVSRGQASDYYAIDKQSGETASHDKTLFIPVPNLEPGRIIDLTLSRQERGEPTELRFRAIPFGVERPVGLRAVYYVGDAGAVRYRAANGVTTQAVPGGLLWSLEGPAVYPQEAMGLPATKGAPTLWLGDAGGDWSALAKGYLASIAAKMVAEAAVSEQARRLTTSDKDTPRRVEALAHHVQTGYVYKPIEFGRRARIPNTAAETLRRKYGDCKDLALLLRQLLATISVPAHLALVSTTDDTQKDIPSLDQFDHMILYLPAADGRPARFFDMTDKGLSLAVSPPLGLAGREALILDPAAPRFERLPPYGKGSSELRLARDVRIASAGALEVSEDVQLTGYYAASLRGYLETLDPAKHKEWGQRVLADSERNAKLGTLAITNLRDPERPLAVRMSYTISERCRTASTTLSCALPAVWETRYLEPDTVPDRRTPFTVAYPFHLAATTTVSATGGGTIDAGAGAAGGKMESVAWSAVARSSGSTSTLTFDCELLPGEYPAPRYAEYVRVASQAIRSAGRDASWHRP